MSVCGAKSYLIPVKLLQAIGCVQDALCSRGETRFCAAREKCEAEGVWPADFRVTAMAASEGRCAYGCSRKKLSLVEESGAGEGDRCLQRVDGSVSTYDSGHVRSIASVKVRGSVVDHARKRKHL